MPADIEDYVDGDELRADLPPGVSLWLIRGKVLHVEYINRPIWVTFRDGGGGGMAPRTITDTYVSVNDRDAPAVGYEVRFKGRVEAVAAGDNLELIGHHTPQDQGYVPRVALSLKHEWRWEALRPVRNNDAGFIVNEDLKKGRNSYTEEGTGWLLVNVPRPADAALPPVDPVRGSVGKLLDSAALPDTAPAPVKAIFGKLLGAAKQAAAAPPPSPWITVDLLTVYEKVTGALQEFMPGIDAEEAAQAESYDSGDDLPPL